ncbi:MAG: hypothetical protein PWR24_1395 [Desulfonauticus sp.]|nr:hypothetical protein [Desulfonauticus sp.]
MLKIKKSRFFLISLGLVILLGCSWAKKGWRTTTSLYKEYVLPTTRVDINKPVEGETSELEFAAFLERSDARLQEFLQEFSVQDTFPTEAWAKQIFLRFNWLNKIEVRDEKGEVFFTYPKENLKQVNFSYLAKDLKKLKGLSATLQDTILGPEIALFKPIYTDKKVKLLLLVHFDPRSLIPQEFKERVNLYFDFKLVYRGIAQEIPAPKKVFTPFGELALDGKKVLGLSRKLGQTWFTYAFLCKGGE